MKRWVGIVCFGLMALVSFGSLCPDGGDGLVYGSLDEAIETEIAGIDFSDLSGLKNCPIFGRATVDAKDMISYVRRFNPDFDSKIADCYIKIGEKYGICGDIAFCQAILETGWFRFEGGTAVSHDRHNYCGLGVVRRGVKGVAFRTVEDGVTAHIQHLFAYATKDNLPKGEKLVDPRFNSVRRGVANTWFDLNNRWAMSHNYGAKIIKIFSDLVAFAAQ